MSDNDNSGGGEEFLPATRGTNPFDVAGQSQSSADSAGGRAVAMRENSEVLAMVMSAKRFPRDVVKAGGRIVNAFCRPTLAEVAQYQFARGGTNITGPSIRAAEAIAQQWGNLDTGWREISRSVGADGVGVSEVEAYCIDYEANNRSSLRFVVRHWRDRKNGAGYALKEERDIYELCANQAQRRKRAAILAQIPGDVVDAAMDQAAATLSAKADTSAEGQKKLVEAFAAYGVDKAAIEQRIQRKLEAIAPAHVVSLKRIYASLRDGMSTADEWFEVVDGPRKGTETNLDDLKNGAGKRRGGAAAAPATPAAKSGDLAAWLSKIENAADSDSAAVLLDQSRSELTEDQQGELAVAWRKKWGSS